MYEFDFELKQRHWFSIEFPWILNLTEVWKILYKNLISIYCRYKIAKKNLDLQKNINLIENFVTAFKFKVVKKPVRNEWSLNIFF